MFFPIEFAAIYQQATYGVAVPAYVFGGGIHNDASTMVEWSADNRRSGIVDYQRNSHVFADVSHFEMGNACSLGLGCDSA